MCVQKYMRLLTWIHHVFRTQSGGSHTARSQRGRLARLDALVDAQPLRLKARTVGVESVARAQGIGPARCNHAKWPCEYQFLSTQHSVIRSFARSLLSLSYQPSTPALTGVAKASPLLSFTQAPASVSALGASAAATTAAAAAAAAAGFIDPDADTAHAASVALAAGDRFELDDKHRDHQRNASGSADVADVVEAAANGGEHDAAADTIDNAAADADELSEERAPASRLIDYVLLVGTRDDDAASAALAAIDSATGAPASSLHRAPEILQQYPPVARADVPLSARVAHFCLPEHEPTSVIAAHVPSGASKAESIVFLYQNTPLLFFACTLRWTGRV